MREINKTDIGKRFLIGQWASQMHPFEATVQEVSPSENYALLKTANGNEEWWKTSSWPIHEELPAKNEPTNEGPPNDPKD